MLWHRSSQSCSSPVRSTSRTSHSTCPAEVTRPLPSHLVRSGERSCSCQTPADLGCDSRAFCPEVKRTRVELGQLRLACVRSKWDERWPVTLLFAVLSSLSGGASDFVGGLGTRRLPSVIVVICSQMVAPVVVLGMVAVKRPEIEDWSFL